MRPLLTTWIALAPYLASCRRWVDYSRHWSLVSGSPPGLSITPSFLPLPSTNQGSKELSPPLPWWQTFGGSRLYIQEQAGPSESSPAGKSLTVAESILDQLPSPPAGLLSLQRMKAQELTGLGRNILRRCGQLNGLVG